VDKTDSLPEKPGHGRIGLLRAGQREHAAGLDISRDALPLGLRLSAPSLQFHASEPRDMRVQTN